MIRSAFLFVAASLVAAAPAAAQTVTGTVTMRERLALPPTAVVEVTLEDVSRADAPAVAIATARIEHPGQPPVPYALSFDPAAIHPGRRYAVRARILDRDQLMFTTTESYLVLTQGHGVEADVLVRRVGAAAPPPSNPAEPVPAAPPAGMMAPVAAPAPVSRPPALEVLPASFIGTLPCDGCAGTRMHVNLFGDDSFFAKLADQGRAGVVDDMGSWAASSDGTMLVLQGRERAYYFALRDATALRPIGPSGEPVGAAGRHDLRKTSRFQPLEVRLEMQGTHRRAGDVSLFTECTTGRTWEVADGAMTAEDVLLTIDGRVAEGPEAMGAGSMLRVDRVVGVATDAMCVPRFSAAPLQRTNWRLVELGDAAVPPSSDARNRPYLVFDDDTDRFSGAGGCNRLVGAYDVNGSGIAMAVAGTMTACPAGDAETRFTAALRNATRYRIVGRSLSLFDNAGTRLARFEADGVR